MSAAAGPKAPHRRGADSIVVGAGGAGLYAALTAASRGANVVLISATPLAESSSYWAQGGVAAAIAPDDSPAAHLADTLTAGRGIVRRSAAEVLTSGAPAAVRGLIGYGVQFDSGRDGTLLLGLEGGHHARRVVHAGGAATGRRIVRQLSAACAEHPGITVVEGDPVVAILARDGQAIGVTLRSGAVIVGRAVVLATGGAAALWSRTTNPAGATGNGLLLAHRAGADLADLEMLQFHPTALVRESGPDDADADAARDGFLVTEAIRGEGARLLGAGGERFVDELAPRDEVARAIETELARTGAGAVHLDMRDVDLSLFPNVVGSLRDAGFDPSRSLIPVAPAAHYMMGGIATDTDGRSSVPGLYAVGECACTGLHGANRLASNSLSECFVFGARAALASLDEPAPEPATTPDTVPRSGSLAASGPPPPLASASREALWRDAGLTRDAAGLTRLRDDPHPLVRLIAASALAREESRGAHRRQDYPELAANLDETHVVVAADETAHFVRWE